MSFTEKMKSIKSFKDNMNNLVLSKGMEKTVDIDGIYSIFIQVDDDGDVVYMNVNKKDKDDEILNWYQIVIFISVVDGNLKYEVKMDDLIGDHVPYFDNVFHLIYNLEKIINKSIRSKLIKLCDIELKDKEPKYVWLNTMEGFSNTWREGEGGFTNIQDFLESNVNDEMRDLKNWKLIEYLCHTDKNFEFNKNMKLK